LRERRRDAGHSVWLRENFGAAKELHPKNSKPSVKRSFLDFFALDCGPPRYRLRMGREQTRCRKNCSTWTTSSKLFDIFQDISSNEIVQQRNKKDQSSTMSRDIIYVTNSTTNENKNNSWHYIYHFYLI